MTTHSYEGCKPVPLISVIVPTYNREGTIERCVRSVLKQTLSDFELIVVDDGSGDATAAVLARIQDPRLLILAQPRNKGVSAARNLGIAKARADILCFLDSDDEYLPDKLSTVRTFFNDHPHIGALIDSFEIQFPESSGKPPKGRINPDLEDSESVRQAVYTRNIYKATPALSVRTQSLAAAGPFDEAIHLREDMDMLIRLTHVTKCASISRVLWKKHWLDQSLSWPVDKFMASLIDIASRHEEYLKVPAYRAGLARDLARHFRRLITNGRFYLLVRDVTAFGRRFGILRVPRLIFEGFIEIRDRRLRQR